VKTVTKKQLCKRGRARVHHHVNDGNAGLDHLLGVDAAGWVDGLTHNVVVSAAGCYILSVCSRMLHIVGEGSRVLACFDV